MNKQFGTRDLFLNVLTNIGCQYEVEEGEDNRIHFVYQGEHFLVGAENDRPYIHVYDYAWKSINLSDIDELARLRKAINEANWEGSVVTVFTIDNETQTMDVHCKTVLLFIPEIPNIEEYLKLELHEFFRAHQLVGAQMEKLRLIENNTSD